MGADLFSKHKELLVPLSDCLCENSSLPKPTETYVSPKGSAIRTCEIAVSEDAPWEVLHVQERRSTSDLHAIAKADFSAPAAFWP